MSEQDIILDYQEVNPQMSAKASVIWLHGLGASSDDFVPIVAQLNLPEELAIRFVFPQAPVQAVTLNMGYEMPAWYDIFGLQLDSKQDEPGIRTAERQLTHLIEQEIKQGIPSDKVVIAGFSQGGAVALHTGLRYRQRLAGVMALSSYLPLAEFVNEEKSDSNQGLALFIAHGIADKTLPLVAGEMTVEYLKNLNYAITWKTYSMAHEVCSQEITDISNWLQQVLA